MSNFNYIEGMNRFYSEKRFLKDRNLSILEFNMRILDMINNDSIPPMEKINFIKIVLSNLDEFISIRLPSGKDKARVLYIHTIENIYQRMNEYFEDIVLSNNLEYIEYLSDIDYKKAKKITDGAVYFVYYTKDNKFNMVPYDAMINTITDRIRLLNETVVFSFLVRFVSDKSFRYVYTGESPEETLLEIQDMINIKNEEVFHYIETTCKSETVMKDFIKYLSLPIDEFIIVPEKMIQFDNVYRIMKKYNTSKELYYLDDNITYNKYDYYTMILEKDMLIHNPFESYQHILDFIDQMCTNSNIQSIFISLYRVAKHSEIIVSLIKAHDLGKNVFVYIEPTARGNEEANLEIIELLQSKGIHVACNYFNYKVHSKIFCAVDQNGIIYTHVGTGNYNEDTAKIYTDLHLLTTNTDIAIEVFRIFQSLFRKEIYITNTIDGYLSSSPANFRGRVIKLIKNESEKGSKGRIFLKCNSLCDSEIIDALFKAADNDVVIKIICRTGCSITAHENITVKSKVGKYLEHERFYIFGNDVFISSADLLLRNISKRLEILCKIESSDARYKIFRIFNKLWTDPNTYQLERSGEWVLNTKEEEYE